MEQFFRNNFSEERWRKAALKNAFQLLGKQRFHHAAAFFLLAGAVRDAIEVKSFTLDRVFINIVLSFSILGFKIAFTTQCFRVLVTEISNLHCVMMCGDYV